MGKVLVVDTSVVLAEYSANDFPPPKSRLMLSLILEVCHKVIFSDKLSKEYQKYRAWENPFMRSWKFEMSQRGKVIPANFHKFNEKMRKFAPLLGHHDSHLVCLGMLGDRIIISSDRAAIDHFDGIGKVERSIGPIFFINPRQLGEKEIEKLMRHGLGT